MPEITAETTDGWQASGLQGTWDAAHDAIGFGNPDTNDSADNDSTHVQWVSARSRWSISRAFFDWDTSGITSTVSSATLKLHAFSNIASDIIVVKSGHDPSTATDDWFSTWLTDQSITLSGWGSGDVTAYSGEIDVTATNAYTEITLNSDALSDLVSLSSFKIAVIDYDYDYSDTSVGTSVYKTGWNYADSTASHRHPIIDYTLAVGYGNDVIGVASANIGKVNGIATADISKVNGI